MRYFPVFMDISDKPVLVIGGGEVASRKVELLLRSGAKITLISPELTPYLASLVENQKCEWVNDCYHSSVLTPSYVMVWVGTNNSELNHMIYEDAHRLGLLVNVVDDQPYCDFITPSMITRGRIQIAISSGGASPVLIRNARQAIETVLPHNMALLADFAAEQRDDIKQQLPTVEQRRNFWEHFFANPLVEQATGTAALEQCYRELLAEQLPVSLDCTLIFYVDDPELLPMKAVRYMQQADLLLISNQACPPQYIELSRRDATKKWFSSIDELKSSLTDAFLFNQRVCIFVPDSEKEAFYDVVVANRCFLCARMV